MNWQDKKRIGEALGCHSWDGWEGLRNLSNKDGHRLNYASTEGKLWDAYQPDVLGEVIPWLKANTHGLRLDCPDRIWWMVSTDYPMASGEYKDFAEAVCALMLAVLESGVTA